MISPHPFQQIGHIYEFLNTVNQKRYIGKTMNKVKRRQDHFRSLRRGTHYNTHLQKAWNKYGEEFFQWNLLEECIGWSATLERERYYIELYQSNNPNYGYNQDNGGAPGKIVSATTKKKQSDYRKNWWIINENNLDAVRTNISQALHNRPIKAREKWLESVSQGALKRGILTSLISRKGIYYVLRNRDGEEYAVYNVNQFCRDFHLRRDTMKYLLRGWEKVNGKMKSVLSYKGWKKVKEILDEGLYKEAKTQTGRFTPDILHSFSAYVKI